MSFGLPSREAQRARAAIFTFKHNNRSVNAPPYGVIPLPPAGSVPPPRLPPARFRLWPSRD